VQIKKSFSALSAVSIIFFAFGTTCSGNRPGGRGSARSNQCAHSALTNVFASVNSDRAKRHAAVTQTR